MDYATLIAGKSAEGSIKNWVNYAVIPASAVVADAESWMEARIRQAAMQKRASLTLAEGESEIDLGAVLPDYLDPVRLYAMAYGPLDFVHEADIDRFRFPDENGVPAGVGLPTRFAVIGRSEMLFDCVADKDYPLSFTYYGRPEALSLANPTNVYTTQYRHVFRWVCIAMAYTVMKQPAEALGYLNRAEAEIAEINAKDDLARRSQIIMPEGPY